MSNFVKPKKKGKKMNEFVDSLKEFMNCYNLNKLQLSRLLKISSTAVNAYFNSNCIPSINIAIRLCEIFDCSLDYLFGISDKVEKTYILNEITATENFTKHLEELLKENNKTVSGMMKDLDLDEYTFYHWKHGKVPMTINVIAISKYFDVSMDFLLGESKKRNV